MGGGVMGAVQLYLLGWRPPVAHTCFECGAPSEHNHHVVPRSRGGTRTVPVCQRCHARAHGHDGWGASTSTLTREAMAAKKARGESVGTPRYGYRLAEDGVHLEPDDYEQRVISRVSELRLAGESLRGIVAALESEGYTARSGKPLGKTQVERIVVDSRTQAPLPHAVTVVSTHEAAQDGFTDGRGVSDER